MAYPGQITFLNVTEQVAPAPSTLQGTGALISLGATNLASGKYVTLYQLSDLNAILTTAGNSSEVLAMATTFFASGSQTAVAVLELGANALPQALDTWITTNPGIFYAYRTPAAWDLDTGLAVPVAPTVTTASGGTLPARTYYTALTYTDALGETTLSPQTTTAVSADNLATVTSPTAETNATGWNVYAGESATSLSRQNTTPIAIGTSWTEPTTGLIVGASPPTINTTDPFTAFLIKYNGLTAQTYFFITSTIGTYPRYVPTMKNVVWLVQSPNAPSTEDSTAAALWKYLTYNPGPANKMTQMNQSFMYGVTAYPVPGNTAALEAILAAKGSYIGTGAQGQISNTVLVGGTTADGNDASYWYSADWFEINAQIALDAAVINGSNNPQNPLQYNQPGINRLLSAVELVGDNGLAYGCLQGVTFSATPFATYVTQNPSDYAASIYNGLAATIVPQNGFRKITFNLTVSNIPIAG